MGLVHRGRWSAAPARGPTTADYQNLLLGLAQQIPTVSVGRFRSRSRHPGRNLQSTSPFAVSFAKEMISLKSGIFLGMMSGFRFALAEVVQYSMQYWQKNASVKCCCNR